MSVYIVMDYITACKNKGLEPSISGLKRHRKMYWID